MVDVALMRQRNAMTSFDKQLLKQNSNNKKNMYVFNFVYFVTPYDLHISTM